MIFRSVLLCSQWGVSGYRFYWEVIPIKFWTRSEASSQGAQMLALGACVGWAVEEEIA